MKILHVAETTRGGCATYLNELLPLQLQALGAAQLRCIVPRQHLPQLEALAPELLIPFDRPGRRAGLWPLTRRIVATVRAWQPDLIHAHSTFAGAIVRSLSLWQRMPPVVYCPHGWVFDVDLPLPARHLARRIERWLSTRCAAVVAISEAERQQGLAAGIAPERLSLVRNGVSANAGADVAAWDDPRLRLLFVGRLDRQKGADVLVQAVAPLADRVCVRIAGDSVVGGGGAALPALPHVSYTGWLTPAQVAAQINACDAVVMPSRWEGFGLVAIEAMRAGKPVLASAVGGLREIVVDGVTGHLVPADDVAALRQLLGSLQRGALQALGAAGRQRFTAHYTSQRTHEELLALYDRVLGGNAHRADPFPLRDPVQP